jgi:cysteinyl-tRNA synthetase
MALELRLYDTLTREKRVFSPIDSARVRMYVCGPTVYDFAHIGNARPVIVFDVLFRLLRHIYGPEHVAYVRNITDVDDKINARAAERGIPIRELTEDTYKNFKSDIEALGCLPPTVEPRATEHIDEMKALIERLVAAGHAYVAEEHVLFDVPSMADYGKLSSRPLDEMIAGARVEVAPYKRSPTDFVLWKPSKAGEPGWPSPCGIKSPGRPGWHIECSAMAWKHLGETFDIHGGGIDLVFPHHENEIAQSRCAFHTGVMASYWLHNGFLQVEGEKMSKSLGNFVTIRDLMRGWSGEPWSGPAIKMAMLGTHYRQPIDWTRERLVEAKADLAIFARYTSRRAIRDTNDYEFAWTAKPTPSRSLLDALGDDLNTPLALSSVRERLGKLEKLEAPKKNELVHDIRFLGIMTEQQRDWLTGSINLSGMPPTKLDQASLIFRDHRVARANNDIEMSTSTTAKLEAMDVVIIGSDVVGYRGNEPSAGQIERLIDARNAARKAKKFAESDRIRDELAAMGVVLKDSKDGTTWEVAR